MNSFLGLFTLVADVRSKANGGINEVGVEILGSIRIPKVADQSITSKFGPV